MSFSPKTIFRNLLFIVPTLILPGINLAQTAYNMTQRTNWTTSPSTQYNDIWGYVDPTGGEYAIIGSRNSTHFVNVSNPDSPVEVNNFSGANSSSWRDFKTYNNYAYGVSEGSRATLQIFDLSNLPNSVSKVYDSNEFLVNAHNIFIEKATARLYAVGTTVKENGVHIVILDLSVNPANPVLIKKVNLTQGYIHDIFVRNHIAYCSHESRGLFVYDLSDPDNVIGLGSLTSYAEQGYNHSSWLSENGNVLAMADENHGLSMKLVSVSDLTDIEVISTFKSTLVAPNATNSLPHNPFIIGNDYVVVSYYHDGVQVYNISDPTTPFRVGYYDTFTDNTGYSSYFGAWGVYPYLSSGNILVSDINNGLFVLTPKFPLEACRQSKDIGGTYNQTLTFTLNETINSGAIIESGANISFKAGTSITLTAGFHAQSGSNFMAAIESCNITAFLPLNAPKGKKHPLLPSYSTPIFDVETSEKLIVSNIAPNPFKEWTSIEYSLLEQMMITIKIVDVLGKEVALLEQNTFKEKGVHQLKFYNSSIPSGSYFLFINGPKYVDVNRIQVVKN